MTKILTRLKDMFKCILKNGLKNVTNSDATPDFSKSRDIFTDKTRDINPKLNRKFVNQPIPANDFQPASNKTFVCPYCSGKDIVKKGIRRKKLETASNFTGVMCAGEFLPRKKSKAIPFLLKSFLKV